MGQPPGSLVGASGIDPSVLRELSGNYHRFSAAVRELVSNAYDADAQTVRVVLASGLEWLEVLDDGLGLTLPELVSQYLRIGGSMARVDSGTTPRGRRRVGGKGIGFLAVARYCEKVSIESVSLRATEHRCPLGLTGHDWTALPILGEVCEDSDILDSVVGDVVVRRRHDGTVLVPGRHYELRRNRWLRSLTGDERTEVEVSYTATWSSVVLKATIDYGYLLTLENRRDLTRIDDFAAVQLLPKPDGAQPSYTSVTLVDLKPHVRTELATRPRRVGRVDAASLSGTDRFAWELSRSAPIGVALPPSLEATDAGRGSASSGYEPIRLLISTTGDRRSGQALTRPVADPGSLDLVGRDADLYVPVVIGEPGLEVTGFVVGHRSVIHPAELRGIAIRVCGVQVGEASFLGADAALTGARRASLAQISGEISVTTGFSASEALKPGRDGFYPDSSHYQVLRRALVGDGPIVGGAVGKVLESILRRSALDSWSRKTVDLARKRRQSLIEFAKTANYQLTQHFGGVPTQDRLAASTLARPNGLLRSPDFDTLPPRRIHDFEIQFTDDLTEEFTVDYVSRKVLLNQRLDIWSWSVPFAGQMYRVVPKAGERTGSLCEMDVDAKMIAVNWSHYAHSGLDDARFLRFALAAQLARLMGVGDSERTVHWAVLLATSQTP